MRQIFEEQKSYRNDTFLKDFAVGLRYLISINTPKIMPAHRDDSIATRASLLGRLKNWEDQQSWDEFAEIYSRLIVGVAMQAGLTEAEAKDVEQETLLRVAQTIHEFESSPERGSFKSWLLTLTRWRIADQFRKRAPSPQPSSPMGEREDTRTSTIERVPDPAVLDAAWESEWRKNLLETALNRVGRRTKPKHLQIFDLYAMRHWPAAKVARELGVSIVQVYLVNHRITKLMKQEVAYLETKLE
ncbi:MAG TPA: sigma-70 family RNA polymerase sigma factor [Verrucomicrobiae bacterium]|nr:sigma-70 family RNA polymerase sigma factor [Verrucomicrobiae bacterium]